MLRLSDDQVRLMMDANSSVPDLTPSPSLAWAVHALAREVQERREASLVKVHDTAKLIYERVGELLWRVPFDDLGTEREAGHRHIGSAKVTEALYQLAREILQ
jgi:hypothetical protein